MKSAILTLATCVALLIIVSVQCSYFKRNGNPPPVDTILAPSSINIENNEELNFEKPVVAQAVLN